MRFNTSALFIILLLAIVAAPGRTRSADCDWQDVLTAYDANGDGRLDSNEREVLRKSRPLGFTCDPGRGTWDRGGEERRRTSNRNAPPPPHPLARFDKDENGRLDASELATARAVVDGKTSKAGKTPINAK